MANPVVHFEIMGKDALKAQKFYADLFGWQIQNIPEMNYGLVNQEQTGGGIGGGISKADGAPNYVTVYIQVDDLQKYLDKAEKLGGRTIVPPTTVPGMVSFAMFTDLDGNMVGLVHEQRPE
jgi:predicted enzyme related to lactoylglutathione lyase